MNEKGNTIYQDLRDTTKGVLASQSLEPLAFQVREQQSDYIIKAGDQNLD